MSLEIAWKQNILVTDSYLLKLLLVVFGFGSQAFICGFSRQNINSVVQISVKIWILDDPLKGTLYWSFGCQRCSSHQVQCFFLMKWGCKGQKVIEAKEVVEAVEAIETAKALRHGKSILRTSESSRVIQVLEFSFILIFWKKIILVELWNMKF